MMEMTRRTHKISNLRNDYDIILDILDSIKAKESLTKTVIMRACNLNFGQVNRYLDFMIRHDLVRAVWPQKRTTELARYKITPQGVEFTEAFQKALSML